MATQNAMPIAVPVIVPILVPNTLRDAAIRSDWPAWAQAWQQIDRTECAALLHSIDMKIAMKSTATLTLCGERSAQTYQASHHGLKNRVLQTIRSYFGPQPLSHILSKL